eukprot:TRINITY_DN8146_c0_g1_i2.p1 TRINITY_DN8146_c0_g1~~TRINITY_DN8146_c0_g1_i2.p1  ORF type:complete len:331 (-),score=97.52 TRINITY_DN8146_c0_g1_i2:27-1019(-)
MPVKWYSVPQCWRFETTTTGRKREHFQWNMDIFGVREVSAEIELLAAIVSFFQRVGLTSKDVGVKVSSRQVVQMVLDDLKIPQDKFAATCIIIDKLDKLPREEVEVQLAALELTPEQASKIIDNLSVKTLDDLAAKVGEDKPVIKELRTLFSLAKSYGIEDWLQFDASIVRGLVYYTGVVFEGFDRSKTIPRSICGGGRYDKLLSLYGGQDQPACGFGFGDCVILEILKNKKLLPKLKHEVDDVILAFNEELRGPAVQVAVKLRAQGRKVDIILGKGKKLAWAYSYADRIGADRVVLVAPSEWEQRKVRIKDLRKELATEKEVDVLFSEL